MPERVILGIDGVGTATRTLLGHVRDVLVDAIGAGGRFGEARLLETVRSLGDGVAAAHRILAAIDRFRVSDQADDIAILSLARAPVPAARPLT